MKKLVTGFAIALLVNSTAIAQNVQVEAIDSLSTAQSFVKDGNYSKAIDEINYALAKINELTATELLKFIPAAPAGFTLVNKQSQGVGAAGAIAGNAGASAQYASNGGGTIDLSIAIGGMTGKMASFAALGSIFAGMGQDAGAGQTRKIRVQGYTGTEMFNANDRTGTLTFQVGEKTSVTIEGSDIESADLLMQLAKNVDLAGIEKAF